MAVVLASIAAVALFLFAEPVNVPKQCDRQRNVDGLAKLMTVHQMHYFAYSSLLPWLIAQNVSHSPLVIASGFAVGWVSYVLSPSVFRQRVSLAILVFGHCLAGGALVGLVFSSGPFLTLLLWFITGFGGGTVYVLRGFADRDAHAPDLDLWEGIGHVLGTVVASALIISCSQPRALFALAALIAFSVAVIGRWLLRSYLLRSE
jgi:hypothetical protein